MGAVLRGRLGWDVNRDKDGHRDYKLQWLVRVDDPQEGPYQVLACPGLPATGAPWSFGYDYDPWATCWPDCVVRSVNSKEPDHWWTVEQHFSTKPLKRCQDNQIENPLAEPPKLSGSFTKFTKEAVKDRFGKNIKSSSHERYRGAAVEFDDNRPNVKVEINRMILPLALFAGTVDRVNDSGLWGCPKRCVKLSNVSWSRQLYGTCNFYYTIGYEFDIKFDTFDRVLPDEGTKVLAPGGNANDPRDFIAYIDKIGQNSRVFLKNGLALADGDNPENKTWEYYQEANMLALGIPSSL